MGIIFQSGLTDMDMEDQEEVIHLLTRLYDITPP